MADPTIDPKLAYEAARKDLVSALTKKRVVDKSLAALEAQLYAFEASYLAETASVGGNIIQGFEAYLKATGGTKKRQEITDADRMFSNSSYTVQRSLELQQGPPTPPPLDFPAGPVTVALPAPSQIEVNAGGAFQNPSRKDRKRTRRGASGASGDEDDGASIVANTRSRPNKRVRES